MREIGDEQAHEPAEHVIQLEGKCPSISGRSTLTYQVGWNPAGSTKENLLRVSDNSGKGMWCKDWAPVSAIDALLTKHAPVSARTFNDVHPGKSVNTGGFILAVLKDLGVVAAKENSKQHEKIPGASLQQAITFKLKEAASLDKHRKAKGE